MDHLHSDTHHGLCPGRAPPNRCDADTIGIAGNRFDNRRVLSGHFDPKLIDDSGDPAREICFELFDARACARWINDATRLRSSCGASSKREDGRTWR
jgi:hypothetical protein